MACDLGGSNSVAWQVIEGAPARLPRDLTPLLSADEVSWLASGRRVELAALTPARLLGLLKDALGGGAEGAPGVTAYQLDSGGAAALAGRSS